MKTTMLFLMSVGMFGQVAPPLPLTVEETNQKFLKACADGEKLFDKLLKGQEKEPVKLFELVSDIDYRLIIELWRRTESEKKGLEGASVCVKSLTKRASVYFGRLTRKLPPISRVQ